MDVSITAHEIWTAAAAGVTFFLSFHWCINVLVTLNFLHAYVNRLNFYNLNLFLYSYPFVLMLVLMQCAEGKHIFARIAFRHLRLSVYICEQ